MRRRREEQSGRFWGYKEEVEVDYIEEVSGKEKQKA